MDFFRASGKFAIAYVERAGEKVGTRRWWVGTEGGAGRPTSRVSAFCLLARPPLQPALPCHCLHLAQEYYLASSFAEIYAPPCASLSLRGMAVAGTFLRGALEKVGVEPEVRRIGVYKSAGDQLLREDLSAEQREQVRAQVWGWQGASGQQQRHGPAAARAA